VKIGNIKRKEELEEGGRSLLGGRCAMLKHVLISVGGGHVSAKRGTNEQVAVLKQSSNVRKKRSLLVVGQTDGNRSCERKKERVK